MSAADATVPPPNAAYDWRRRWLAIDLGDKRIGLATTDAAGMIASPAGYIARREGKRPPLMAMLARAEELAPRGSWWDCRSTNRGGSPAGGGGAATRA